MKSNAKPAVLLILDGWGYSESDDFNAIHAARTPVWDRLWQEHPHTLIGTAGADVGLPAGQMGNSEVGHLNLGAGRVVFQELTRVSRAVESGEFFSNTALTQAIDKARAANGALHIFGLLSPGGVHSHEKHIHALVRMAVERGCEKVFMHAFLDGRDTPPRSAAPSLEALQKVMDEVGGGRIATIIGRYYAMDRDNRWERVQVAYDMLTQGSAEFEAADAQAALQAAYDRDETDEFVKATRIGDPAPIEDGDAVVFMNYRADRARELTRTFIEQDFDGFQREKVPRLSAYVSLTEYNEEFLIPVAFPPERLSNGFGEYLAQNGRRQLRLAETEKYAHVTFFFNGGREEAFEGEERILVPSPKVATYDLQPEMSAPEVTDNLVAAIESGDYDAIICNFANPDMVGHTGIYEAAVRAIETIDRCLGRIIDALQRAGGELLITADHGNAEQMVDRETGQPHTAHTNNPVPLIYVGREAFLREDGALCDIAPTLLQIMGLEQPAEMSGRSLVSFPEAMAS
jgi:2,3-bisphosphoglycerate-independent phosphoglycerate mutase